MVEYAGRHQIRVRNAMDKTKSYCNSCNQETNHGVAHSIQQTWQDDEYDERCRYLMLQCLGCESVKLQSLWSSNGCDEVQSSYPPPTFRRPPKWLFQWRMQFGLQEAYEVGLFQEIYTALQNAQPRLAAMGVRALLERVMVSKVGDLGSFPKHLNAFEQAGYVSTVQAKRIATVLDVGHAAIHRGFTPNKDDLIILVDILEHVLESIYVHDELVKSAGSRVPPRQRT